LVFTEGTKSKNAFAYIYKKYCVADIQKQNGIQETGQVTKTKPMFTYMNACKKKKPPKINLYI